MASTPNHLKEKGVGPMSPGTQAANSPRAKRSLSFNWWEENQENDQKRAKIENREPLVVKINDLTLGNYEDSINFRVCLKKIFEKQSETGTDLILSIHGMDDSGEVSMVAFGEEAKKFMDLIKVNMCLSLTTFCVKPSSANYENTTRRKFDIQITDLSILKEIDAGLIPAIPFCFKTVKEALLVPDAAMIDLLGIVCKNWGVRTTRTGLSCRDLTLTDASKHCIRLTLWKNDAIEFGDSEMDCIAIRKAKVNTYEGVKCLNAYAFTLAWSNPDIPENEEARKELEEN